MSMWCPELVHCKNLEQQLQSSECTDVMLGADSDNQDQTSYQIRIR